MKLTYFAVRGRAEPARLMLEIAGVPYEDDSIAVDKWRGPEGKERMTERSPFGQLPILEDGPLILCQSGAINRYLARKFGFYAGSPEQDARVDEVYETGVDILFDIGQIFWSPQFHERRAEHRAATRNKLELLQKYFLRTRAGAEHWVVPGRYTMGDISVAFALENLLVLHSGLLQEFAELHRFVVGFFESERVRPYVRSARRHRTYTVALATFGGKPEDVHHWTE